MGHLGDAAQGNARGHQATHERVVQALKIMRIEGDNIVQYLGMQVECFVQSGIGIDYLAHHVFLTSTLEYPFYRAALYDAIAQQVYLSCPRKTGALSVLAPNALTIRCARPRRRLGVHYLGW